MIEGVRDTDVYTRVYNVMFGHFGCGNSSWWVEQELDRVHEEKRAAKRAAKRTERDNVTHLRPLSTQQSPPADAPLTIAEMVLPALQRAERRQSGEERPVPLPFPSYEKILGGGLWPGVHMKVAGTGVG